MFARQALNLETQERVPGTAICTEPPGSSGRDLATVPIPDIAKTIPSILEDVLMGNLKCEPPLIGLYIVKEVSDEIYLT